MKVIGFAFLGAAVALTSCAAPAAENIRPALIANLCRAEADMAGIIMKKRQAGAPQSEVLNSFGHESRPETVAIIRRLVAAAYAHPRTDDAAAAVERFKTEQSARCLRVTH